MKARSEASGGFGLIIGLLFGWAQHASAAHQSSVEEPPGFIGSNATHFLCPTLPEQVSPVSSDTCLTPGCIRAAARLLDYIDPTLEPCTDFYQFACGRYLKEPLIADHKTSIGEYDLIRDKVKGRLRQIFESETKPDEPQVYSSIRNLFKSCMDEEYIEAKGREEALAILVQLGGWPVITGETWQPEVIFSWSSLVELTSKMGFSTDKIITADITTDPDNSTRRIFYFDQPSLGLSREYLIKGAQEKEVQAYYRYMVATAEFFGAEKAAAEKEMLDVLNFELQLANISVPKEQRRNKTLLHNPMRLSEMSKLWPGIDWVQHVINLMDNDQISITGDEIVDVASPSYIKQAALLLPTIPARIQANYLLWRVAKNLLSFLDPKAKAIQLTFEKAITGKVATAARWEICTEAADGLGRHEVGLSNAVGAMYVQKHFPLSTKELVDRMVKSIREEFVKILDETQWMDPKTKELAHKKVDQMVAHVAYPNQILDRNLLDELYQGLNLTSRSFVKNYLTLARFASVHSVKKFREPIDKHSWKTHGSAAVVNAFYSSAENAIIFPAGVMDGGFFQADWPMYLNYGGIGKSIGHEITHGFDDKGSQNDGEGNLVNWWADETRQQYLQKAKCIIDQYSNYTVEVNGEKIHLNGINTQGENIADNGGLKEALRAYLRSREESAGGRQEPRLPGLDYTPRQLFWLSAATTRCTAYRPGKLKSLVLTDPHSPGQFRVNGPLSNMAEFAADWNCPLGSPMNPASKCEVW